MHFIAMGMAVAATMGLILPARAQVVIYNDQSPTFDRGEGETEAHFLQRWNRRHDARGEGGHRLDYFGPDDVVRLLERRGYRVRDVDDVGERYLVKAWRDGDNLLVSVSRGGEIMGVVHQRY